MINILLISALLLVCLFYFMSKFYKLKIEQLYLKMEEELEKLPEKVCFEINGKEITNINKEELKNIREKIILGTEYYENNRIVKNGSTIFIKSLIDKKEIEKLKTTTEIIKDEMRQIKDREYYFYKTFITKLTYLLNEIDDYYFDIQKIKTIGVKYKVENIRNKVEFLIAFFKEKGNAEFHKYRLCRLDRFVKELKEEFKGKVVINETIGFENKELYIESDKVYIIIKTILYSLLKYTRVEKEIKFFINKSEEEMIEFLIEDNKSLESFHKIIDEDFLELNGQNNQNWFFSIEDASILLKIPSKEAVNLDSEEIKTIIINSNIKNLKKIEKSVLYDMSTRGFSDTDIGDMKLVLDEILVNSIEHGNKFDESKKVTVNYKFENNDSKIVISVEDEGSGFDLAQIKKPDVMNERGRGIFISRKLLDKIEFQDVGNKVVLIKNKS